MLSIDPSDAAASSLFALGLLAALLVLNVVYVDENTNGALTGTEPNVSEDRIVAVRNLSVQPGDRVALRWHPEDLRVPEPGVSSVDFHVVEPGHHEPIVEGDQPPFAHVEITNASVPHEGESPPVVSFHREIPDDLDTGSQPHLTLVWVFSPEPGETFPTEGQARQHLAASIGGQLDRSTVEASVTHAQAARAQPWFFAAQAALAQVALAMAGLALWPREGSAASPDWVPDRFTDPDQLRVVRDLLATSGVLIVPLALFGVLYAEEIFLPTTVVPSGFGYDAWLTIGFQFVLLSILIAWGLLLLVAHRAVDRGERLAGTSET